MKFCMLRAPIWITSAASSTASTCAGVHQLGHDRQPGLLARLAQDHERVLAEPLERVRRRPRLEGAASQPGRARLVDRTRGLQRLLAVLDRARPGDQAEELVSDLAAVDVDHRRVGRDLARDELVRLQDRQHLLDAGVALERQRRQQLALADRADHGRLAPARDARVHPGLLQPREHVLGLVGRRAAPITIRSSGDPFADMSS